MRKQTDNIEIQEPAIQEITKKRSCVRQSCTSSCGCITIFLILSFLFLWFIIIPRPKNVDNLPASFPENIIVYDEKNIDSITVRTNDEQDPRITSLAVIPQYVLQPIVSFVDEQVIRPYFPGLTANRQFSNWSTLVALLREPEQTKIDTYIVAWTELSAEPSFIKEYYEKRLRANGFTVSESGTTLTFEQNAISGLIEINDPSPRPGTDSVRLTVSVERP